MSDDQPPREPSDPGPDWRPRFGWRQAIRWGLEGFLLPTSIYFGVLIAAGIVIWMRTDANFSDALHGGAMLASFGFLLSGGGMAGGAFLADGAKWSTFFRILGVVIAITLLWNVVEYLVSLI